VPRVRFPGDRPWGHRTRNHPDRARRALLPHGFWGV